MDGSALPRGLSFDCKIYLRSISAEDQDRFILIIRYGPEECQEFVVDKDTLEEWSVGECEAHHQHVSRQLNAICDRPRDNICGLGLDAPALMGIVNVTPDSFSDGGLFQSAQAAISHAEQLVKEGASILDIGGESTRPGANPVSLSEELDRVIPVVEGCLKFGVPISIDTRNAAVMTTAMEAGVRLINDVSALTHDPDSIVVAEKSGLPVCLMHSSADPSVMQDNPHYDQVLLDVYDSLEKRIENCEQNGMSRDRLIIDPGIGFGKTVDHNLALIKGLSVFHSLGCPVMLGASRKAFIGKLDRAGEAADRIAGSVAVAIAGVQRNVQILRVHDVAATRQALAVWQAIDIAEELG